MEWIVSRTHRQLHRLTGGAGQPIAQLLRLRLSELIRRSLLSQYLHGHRAAIESELEVDRTERGRAIGNRHLRPATCDLRPLSLAVMYFKPGLLPSRQRP